MWLGGNRGSHPSGGILPALGEFEVDTIPAFRALTLNARTMRSLMLWLVPIVTLVVPELVAAQTPAPRTESVSLSPGDSVRITVWRKPEFSGDFVVAPDGTITHPLFRSVRVAGLPFATAAANLRTFLGQYEESPSS